MVNPPSDIGVVENAPTEKEPKKKRSYKPNRRIKRPWCRDLALRNAELRKARSAMRRELEEKAKSEQLTTSETEAQATSAQPSANEPESLVTPGTSTEGVDSEVPPRRKRGRPKGYSPRNKKVVVNRKPRGPTQKKPDNLEPIRRSTRVAEKRKFVENEVPPIVKKLKLDLQAAMHILGKS